MWVFQACWAGCYATNRVQFPLRRYVANKGFAACWLLSQGRCLTWLTKGSPHAVHAGCYHRAASLAGVLHAVHAMDTGVRRMLWAGRPGEGGVGVVTPTSLLPLEYKATNRQALFSIASYDPAVGIRGVGQLHAVSFVHTIACSRCGVLSLEGSRSLCACFCT